MPWKPEICSLQKLLTPSQTTFHSCETYRQKNIIFLQFFILSLPMPPLFEKYMGTAWSYLCLCIDILAYKKGQICIFYVLKVQRASYRSTVVA